jgi:hypothetical protein
MTNNSGMTNNSNMTNNSDSMIESAVPPSIEADEIVETPETAEASPRVRTSNQGATPLLRGGKLYRRLSSKKDKKAHRKVTKKSKGSKRNKHGKRK